MKIRDLWRRVGEKPGPRRAGGSVLTNRPEVNVLDRPWIASPAKADLSRRTPFLRGQRRSERRGEERGRGGGEGGTAEGKDFRPFRYRRNSYRKFVMRLASLRRKPLTRLTFPFLSRESAESITAARLVSPFSC